MINDYDVYMYELSSVMIFNHFMTLDMVIGALLSEEYTIRRKLLIRMIDRRYELEAG